MARLEGKIAVITGGNSGIGLAAARRFASEGAHVYITGRRQDELDITAAGIGPGVTAVQGDVTKAPDLDRLFDMVRTAHGHIDILLANAGAGRFEPLGQITETDFDRTFDVNVKGAVFTVQKALPLMAKGASVILTGSTTGARGGAAFSIYSASKAAIRNLARSWALDLKGTSIRVNVLSPGPTDTPGLNGLAPGDEDNRAFVAAFEAAVPLGRMGAADEIAAAALFLASDDSSFINGAELFADGGLAQV